MTKIWHPYTKWEEVAAGMWRRIPSDNEEELLACATKFMREHKLFGLAMRQVIQCWKYSCEQNLSDASINRRAWMGQAALALALGVPEQITRKAWWQLTQKQQDNANTQADNAIAIWEAENAKN